MTRTRKTKSTKISNLEYSIHIPNKSDISEQELEKRFEKLKKLLSTRKNTGE